MIRIVGEYFLILALLFSFIQSILPLLGIRRNNTYLLASARPAAIGQFVCILLAYILLTIAFAINDFSIAYVAENSHPALPLMYRLAAVWGAHEGSILLWIFMLSIWTIIFSTVQKNNNELPIILSVLGIINFCFLCFLLLTSNPFLPILTLQTGSDLNPLLQDPGFVIHPPMLYMGYVGFSVAFAINLAALITNKLDNAWASLTRRFALIAWCFLTLGIALGSWWAYRVLGWGGFWFWDPVENASLLPWLSGIALIHVLLIVEKRGDGKSFAAFLALICFALSLLGTFLVRSGVLISAHTFANDPARGVFLLLLLTLIMTAALSVYIFRMSQLKATAKLYFPFLSREMSLLLNSALLLITMLTILLGTLYPLIFDALHLGSISVGAPYFNTVMLPLTLVILFFMGLAALSRWGELFSKQNTFIAIKQLSISFLIACTILFGITNTYDVTALICLSLSCFILMNLFNAIKFAPGMALAHTGFALLVIGVMLSSLLNVESDLRLKPGAAANIGPYQFFFVDTESSNGSNYRGIRAHFDVIKNKHHIANLYPEKRIYTVRDMVMTKVDIHPGIFRDLYIALGEPLDQDEWSLRIYYKPFIRWIWFGAFLMILGGLLSMRNKRYVRPSEID